jgi:NDP-sugar pyrophosphorylase family protein
MKPTLLVLAAGMGSRYGGLKQLDRFGPSGETIMDYSVHDALGAGFGKVVFVIRRDFESAFRTAVGDKYGSRVSVEYVFQQLDDLPSGFTVPSGRTKPWGTAHAIWCARRAIAEPFVSINADDYYGKRSFKAAAEYLARSPSSSSSSSLSSSSSSAGPADYCMVGYPVLQTLSEHAAVTRAICKVDGGGFLEALVECTKVEREGNGARYVDETGKTHHLTGDQVVSMNFWGFTPSVFGHLERHLTRFLERHGAAPGTSECLIPVAIDELIKEKAANVSVLPTSDTWFGVTHPEDKPNVMKTIQEMVARGEYPTPIWDNV